MAGLYPSRVCAVKTTPRKTARRYLLAFRKHSYESGLDWICCRDNYAMFGWELYAGGIMYTEDIESGKKEYDAEFNSGEYGRENYKYKKISENFYAVYDSPI